MAVKNTLQTIGPDGTVATRKTDHPYIFAVWGYSKSWKSSEYTWGVYRWTTREDLAAKALSEFNGWVGRGYTSDPQKFELAPVTEVTK